MRSAPRTTKRPGTRPAATTGEASGGDGMPAAASMAWMRRARLGWLAVRSISSGQRRGSRARAWSLVNARASAGPSPQSSTARRSLSASCACWRARRTDSTSQMRKNQRLGSPAAQRGVERVDRHRRRHRANEDDEPLGHEHVDTAAAVEVLDVRHLVGEDGRGLVSIEELEQGVAHEDGRAVHGGQGERADPATAARSRAIEAGGLGA